MSRSNHDPVFTSPAHPLADLDGKKKYIFSYGDEDFFLRIVTSKNEITKHPEVMTMLGPKISYEAGRQLAREGRRLKRDPIEPSDEQEEKWLRETMPNRFEKEDNYTVFIFENREGVPVGAAYMTINDPKKRHDLAVSPDIKTFLFLDGAMVNAADRGRGIVSSGFDDVLILFAERFMQPTQYAATMKFTTLADDKEHLVNLGRYASMWHEKITPEIYLQERWQTKAGIQLGRAKVPLRDFISQDGKKIDEDKVSDWAKHNKALGLTRDEVFMGSFIIGDMPAEKNREALEGQRKVMLSRKQSRDTSIHVDESKMTDWHSAPITSPRDAKITKSDRLTTMLRSKL